MRPKVVREVTAAWRVVNSYILSAPGLRTESMMAHRLLLHRETESSRPPANISLHSFPMVQ